MTQPKYIEDPDDINKLYKRFRNSSVHSLKLDSLDDLTFVIDKIYNIIYDIYMEVSIQIILKEALLIYDSITLGLPISKKYPLLEPNESLFRASKHRFYKIALDDPFLYEYRLVGGITKINDKHHFIFANCPQNIDIEEEQHSVSFYNKKLMDGIPALSFVYNKAQLDDWFIENPVPFLVNIPMCSYKNCYYKFDTYTKDLVFDFELNNMEDRISYVLTEYEKTKETRNMKRKKVNLYGKLELPNDMEKRKEYVRSRLDDHVTKNLLFSPIHTISDSYLFL